MPGLAELRTRVRDRLSDPVAWTEVIQLVKTVVAAVAAWVVATEGFGLEQAYLAPWFALLIVQSTVYRTLSDGIQQVAATVLGVAFAWLAGNLLGLDPTALAVMLLVALTLGKISALHLDGTAVATTALIVLTIGYTDDHAVLLLRFVDTAIGIAVGLFVNLIVWPPLRDYSAARAIDRLDDKVGRLLRDIAAQLREDCGQEDIEDWVDRSRAIEDDLDEAWSLLRQARESGRMNPRRGAAKIKQPGEYNDLLHRIEQTSAEIRSMARTLGHSITDVNIWGGEFRSRWTELLDTAGMAIEDPDSRRMGRVRRGLQDLSRDLSTGELSTTNWVEYGGLILNLRNIVVAMDRLAEYDTVAGSAVSGHRPTLRG
ncbi:MAG TPA: aromatic acid exporter family protein [Nocardioidaceae bacterium]|nr:aromatic acid exporter family protein [Nocardioidaceae bacterium]